MVLDWSGAVKASLPSMNLLLGISPQIGFFHSLTP
jgi:hypothetical protein